MSVPIARQVTVAFEDLHASVEELYTAFTDFASTFNDPSSGTLYALHSVLEVLRNTCVPLRSRRKEQVMTAQPNEIFAIAYCIVQLTRAQRIHPMLRSQYAAQHVAQQQMSTIAQRVHANADRYQELVSQMYASWLSDNEER